METMNIVMAVAGNVIVLGLMALWIYKRGKK